MEEEITKVPAPQDGLGFLKEEGDKIFYGVCAAAVAAAMYYLGWHVEAKTVFITVAGACITGMQGKRK